MDGFEGYGDADGQAVAAALSRRYTVAGTHSIKNDGRYGGWSIQPDTASGSFLTPTLTTDNTLIVSFALKFPINLDSIASWFVDLWSGGTVGMRVGADADGALRVYLSGVELQRTVPSIINPRRWQWIEFKVVCDNAAGAYELKVDGISVLSATGVDTQSNLAYYDQVMLSGVDGSVVETPRFDDFFVMDGTGSDHNDFVGQRRINVITPDGDTASVDWTTSSGSNHWELVDDLDPDDDATYVEDTVSANKDIWTYDDLSDLNSIDAVCLITDVRVTDANTYGLTTIVKSGGTEYDVNMGTISSTSYSMPERLMTEDPDTLTSWTQGGVNSIEMGVEVI
jgi:hypothetical protein